MVPKMMLDREYRGVKRDTEIVVLLGFLLLLLLTVTGRHGALTVGTVHNKSNYIFSWDSGNVETVRMCYRFVTNW